MFLTQQEHKTQKNTTLDPKSTCGGGGVHIYACMHVRA